MHYFCPSCWKEVEEKASLCSFCGLHIDDYLAESDFIDKLLSAINHFEAETRIRAVTILGKRKERNAIPRLLETVKASKDVFLVAASLEALFDIGRDEFCPVFQQASKSPYYLISQKAVELLGMLKK